MSGIENFKNVLIMLGSAFPDLHITVEDPIVEGDKVVTRFSIRATHKGDLTGIPPTGKPINVTGISIIRFIRGKAVEEWIEEGGLGLMRPVGRCAVSRQSFFSAQSRNPHDCLGCSCFRTEACFA